MAQQPLQGLERELPDHDDCPDCGKQRVRVDGTGWATPSMFCICQLPAVRAPSWEAER